MNIIDELIESYTYNGVVSQKAIEDDIATLENQIESYNFTLNEVRLRRKNDGPLVSKIRDAKIRLSLLKAVEKKVKEHMSSDAAIVNMLGISGKSAKEVEEVGTVANGKEPIPQNFESAEAEPIEEVNEVVSEENKFVPQIDIGTESGIITIGEHDPNAGVDYMIPQREAGKENNELGIVNKPDNKPIEEVTALTEKPEIEPEETAREEVSIPTEEVSEHEVDIEANGPIDEKELNAEYVTEQESEDGFRPDIKIEPQKSEEERKINVLVPEFNMEDRTAETVPPPTIDDYMEPVDTVKPEASMDEKTGEMVFSLDSFNGDVEYQNPCLDCDVTECIRHPESDTFRIEPIEPEIKTDEPTFGFDDFLKPNEDFDTVYKTFPEEVCKMSASVDLCSLTNMVNTMHIEPIIDFTKKTLSLRFFDIRDYGVFLELVRLRKKNRWWSRFFEKNLPTIFMTAEANVDGAITEYRFAFNRCRVVEVSDSEFRPLDEPVSFHDCYAIISYSNVTILHGTTNKENYKGHKEVWHEETDDTTEKGAS